jgi:glycosyltransferase involved in cell wall biosynthesis
MSTGHPLILIDALGIDKPGGARTAVLYLFEKVFAARSGWHFIVFLSEFEQVYEKFPNVKQIVIPLHKGMLARLFVQSVFPILILALNVDLVHFAKSQGALVFGCKKVLTIFDVTTLHYPKMHSKLASWYWKHIMPVIARSHDAIITISNDAAKDIQAEIGVPKEQVFVIPCASQFNGEIIETNESFTKLQRKHQLQDQFLLFVGILAIKKNLKTLIQALAILRAQQIEFPCLVMAGPYYPQSEDREIFNTIANLNMEDKTNYIGCVSHEDLAALYTHATALLLPSVHEGFGITLLEAMEFGTPVITSNISSMPEVVGSAGLLVDNYLSPQAWASKIQQLLIQPDLRQKLIDEGYERCKLFSWDSSASQLITRYETLLSIKQSK